MIPAAGRSRWPERDVARGALACVLVLGAALRVGALDTPLYIDEIVTLTVAAQPLDRMARAMRLIDASPALTPLLLHAWLTPFDSDAWARSLMALFGWLTIPMAYAAGSRAFDRESGLWAAFGAAMAPSLVHYSQYVRGYSLFTLLSVTHLWLALGWFCRRPARGTPPPSAADGPTQVPSSERPSLAATLAVTGVVTAMLYTHYLSLLYFVAPGTLALVRLRRQRARASAWVAAHGLAAVLFLPGVPLLAHNIQADAVRNEERPLPPPAHVLVPNVALEMFVGQRALGFSDPTVRRSTLVAAAVVFPALVIMAAASGWRDRRCAVLLLLGTAVVPLAIYVVTGRRLVAVRFFLPSTVAGLVLAGYALRLLRVPARTAAAVALAVLAAVPLWHFYTAHEWSYDHRRVARAIQAEARPGDVMLVVHPYEALYYRRYLGNGFPIIGATFTPLSEQAEYVIKPEPLDAIAAIPRLETSLRSARRVWVVGESRRSFASSEPEERRLLAWMERRYGELARLDALTGGDPAVRLYRADGAAPR